MAFSTNRSKDLTIKEQRAPGQCTYLGWVKVGSQGWLESFRASGRGDTANIRAETRHEHMWRSSLSYFQFFLMFFPTCINRKTKEKYVS